MNNRLFDQVKGQAGEQVKGLPSPCCHTSFLCEAFPLICSAGLLAAQVDAMRSRMVRRVEHEPQQQRKRRHLAQAQVAPGTGWHAPVSCPVGRSDKFKLTKPISRGKFAGADIDGQLFKANHIGSTLERPGRDHDGALRKCFPPGESMCLGLGALLLACCFATLSTLRVFTSTRYVCIYFALLYATHT